MRYLLCFTLVFLFDYSKGTFTEINITKGNYLGLLTIPKEYEVSFEVYLSSFVIPANWTNIIRITNGNQCCHYESRIATVFFKSDILRLEFNFPINGIHTHTNIDNEISLKKWTKITMKQYLNNGNYFYAIEIDGKTVHSVQNYDARVFKNVKLYVSDPWWNAQPGSIRNLSSPDIDECTSTLHTCDEFTSTCLNTDGSYLCICKKGYTNYNKTFCVDIDECTSTLHTCDDVSSTCSNNNGSYVCNCKEGYTNYNKLFCVDIDECTSALHTCNDVTSTCSNTDGSYVCNCNNGFINYNNTFCVDIDECTSALHTCDNVTSTCSNNDGSYVCSCISGHTNYNKTFCVDIDECTSALHTCDDVTSTCSNTDGSYVCNCNKGYTSNDKSICVDIDECTSTLHTCDNVTSTCSNTNGSYVCNCNNGYTIYNKTFCVDIDECTSTLHTCDDVTSTCSNTNGSYVCNCNKGYTNNNKSICVDIDECNSSLDLCNDVTTTCLNTNGSYVCSCISGYTNYNKTFCVDMDECTNALHTCNDDTTTCSNTDGSFVCNCKIGYTNYNKTLCIDIDECSSTLHLCNNVTSTCSNTNGSYGCNCKKGYTNYNKTFCVDIDECTLHFCNNVTSTCSKTNGSYVCNCKEGYTNYNKTFCVDIDECNSSLDMCDDVTSTCLNTNGSYVCSCISGHTNYNKTFCVDIDECTSALHTCDAITSTCSNTNGSFVCNCNNGYTNYNKTFCVAAPLTTKPMSETSQKLNDLKNVKVTESNILNVTHGLSEIVYSGKLSDRDEVEWIPSILLNVINALSLSEDLPLKNKITSGILFSIDGLSSPDMDLIKNTNQKFKLSAEFLNIIDYLGKQQTENLSISMKNIGMASYYSQTNTNQILISSIINENITGVSITSEESGISQSENYIILPRELFVEQNKTLVYSFIFKQKYFFRETSGILDSVIISATLNNNAATKYNNSISMKFSSKSMTSGNRKCQFYIIAEQRWSSNGCNTTNISLSEVFCQCNHLTNFALILDVDQSGNNPLTLSIITWVGCAISIVGLFITIISYSAFSNLRRKLGPKILIILCVNLMCTLILFVALVERTKPRGLCQTVASLLQFFILSTFFWMAIEGFNLYRMFIKVLGVKTSSRNFLIKSSIFGWGVPLFITVVTSVSKPKYLGHSSDKDVKICVVRSFPFYFGILLPVCVVMAANIIILLLVLRGIHYNSIPNKNRSKKKVRIAFVCSLLLGMTWLFAVLAIGKTRDIFQWLFCIFNSLQGFFIFVFYTVENKNVKDQWMLFFWNIRRRIINKLANSSRQRLSSSTLSSSTNSSQVNGSFISSEDTKL